MLRTTPNCHWGIGIFFQQLIYMCGANEVNFLLQAILPACTKNCKFSSIKLPALKRKAAIFLFSIVIAVLPLFVKAQSSNYHVQFFDEASGINAGAFQRIDITKDKDNFLWILQTTKVQRYEW